MSNSRYKLLSEDEIKEYVPNGIMRIKDSSRLKNALIFICGMALCYVILFHVKSEKKMGNFKSFKEMLIKPFVTQKFENYADFYFTKDESRFLNCSQITNGSKDAIESYVNNGRLKLEREKLLKLPMDCENIKTRIRGDIPSFSKLERPIAFVRNIFTLYEFQESLISLNYHPDNSYCFSIDFKTVHRLSENMLSLSKCLPNIIINPMKYSFDSAGHFQDRAHFDCLKLILNRTWYHTLLLQNYDIVLKSSEQLSDLSEMLNYTSIMGLEYGYKHRYKEDANWTPAGLKLFKNEKGVPDRILHTPLTIRKGLNEVFLSKTFVDSLFDKLNLDPILDLFDNKELYGVDEMLIPTLYENYLGLEGQMTSNCTKLQLDNLTRQTDWNFNGPDGYDKNCKSKMKRHSICIIGVEYLQDFSNSNQISANKVLDNFDFGPIICLRQMIREGETNGISEDALNWSPQYREMKLKQNGTYIKEKFEC
ncbi:unnamed protein product [Caenorhabditis angaria]|uniref:Uncharacterized protein n=1 Tax=Caenorhabditis angaria TaxID=860376 RepID=A0A9P1IEF5_9PELO|nr:unnamed protein product [Caenorhabditis angaria]